MYSTQGVKLRNRVQHLLLILVLTLMCGVAPAQSIDSLRMHMPLIVDSIVIRGNTITEPDIILKELPFVAGDTVSRKTLEFAEERVFSLGIFNQVKMFLVGENTSAVCSIFVEESWYIYPLPFLDLKEGDWNKVSYGMNILIKNFRGRNEDLSFTFGLGYDPFYSVTYQKPYLIRSENISFYFSSQYSNIANKSIEAELLTGKEFSYKFFLVSVGGGKRFDLYNRVDMFLNYLYVKSDYTIPGITATGNQKDYIPSVNFGFTHDSRDLKQFPDNGLFFNSIFQFNGLGSKGVNYLMYRTDFRHYQKIYGNLSGKLRLYQRNLAGKKIPFYDNSFLGLDEKIRGFYNQKTEGRQLYLAAVEAKFPIIGKTDLQFDFPVIPRQLQGFRTAVYLTVFADAGLTVDRAAHVKSENILSGFGAGITILALPYNLARFEYAINKFGKNEFIISLGVAF